MQNQVAVQEAPTRQREPGSPEGGRWLHVLSHLHPKYGGVSTVVPQLAARLAATGAFTTRLAAFCLPGEQYQPSTGAAVPTAYWPVSRKTWLLDRPLNRAFRQSVAEADGVHVHGLWEQSTLSATHAARALGRPYILSAHGMLEPWALESKRRKKQLYASLFERDNIEAAACLHALTLAEARNYRKFGSRRPIAVIPNGVEVPDTISPDAFLRQFPVAEGKRLVIFLGRLHRKKGIGLLTEAWSAVAPQWPDAMLVLAGPAEDDSRHEAERAAAQSGVASQMLCTGLLDSTLKWSALAASECFVLPSYSEGLSISALEAMGAGLPVILTENCNLPEVVEAQCGWQIKADAEELRLAIEACLANSSQANRELGARGAALVERRYSWPVVASQMAELYSWVEGGALPRSFTLQLPASTESEVTQ